MDEEEFGTRWRTIDSVERWAQIEGRKHGEQMQ